MNKTRFLTFVLIIGTLVLSACGAAAPTATPAPVSATQNVEAMPVSFVGIVDSMAGDQWIISGTTVTVDESIVRDGPFKVGDTIKVEGFVSPNGSFQVSRVGTPTPQDALTATPFVDDNSNDANANDNANINDDNSNGLNSNDDNSNTVNSNDDNGGGNSNEDNSNTVNSNDDNGGGGGNSNDDNGNGG